MERQRLNTKFCVLTTFSEIRPSRNPSNDVGLDTCRDKPVNSARINAAFSIANPIGCSQVDAGTQVMREMLKCGYKYRLNDRL